MRRVGLARYATSASAIVFDLPGCSAAARDADAAIAMLPVVIAEHAAWLRGHGADVAADGGFEIVEDVAAAQTGAADDEFCFEFDRAPATREEVERALRHLAWSREDLLRALERCPEAVLDWKLPEDAAVDVDEWAPGVRTIRGIARHVASSEPYYRTALPPHEMQSETDESLADLALQRSRLVERLGAVTDGELRAVYRVRRPWQQGEEEWSVRKVLRRVIGHERFHTAEIEQRRAWLFLGVPRRQ